MLDKIRLYNLVKSALAEDRASNDITTRALCDLSNKGRAEIIARREGILCGLQPAEIAFKTVDPRLKISSSFADGDKIKRDDVVMVIAGSMASILRAERTALNFLSHLSGISTLTSLYVDQVKGAKIKILDTRKTLPGLRDLEKYAVTKGGGHNHRRDLSDMYLIKENHLEAAGQGPGLMTAGDIGNALQMAIAHRERVTSRRKTGPPLIEVEVCDLKELAAALNFPVDRIMLDNFSAADARKAVKLSKERKSGRGRIEIEISGGIDLKNIKKYAATGVDYISVGRLTHSAPAFDFSLIMRRQPFRR